MNLKGLSLFLGVLFISISSFSQRQSITEKADEAFYAKQFTYAIELYQEAYSDVKLNRQEKDRVLFQLAESYRLVDDKNQALKTYKRLVTAKYFVTQPKIYLHLADMHRFYGEWDDAEFNYKEYLKLNPKDELAQRRLSSIALAKNWMKNPTKHDIKNEKNVNTEWNDWAPRFLDSKDNTLITFTSSRPNGQEDEKDIWTGEYFSDIYTTQKLKTGELAEGLYFNDAAVNTEFNEGEMVMIQSGKLKNYYFTRCNLLPNKELNCAIYSRPIQPAKGKAKQRNTQKDKGNQENTIEESNQEFVKLNLGDTIYNYLHPAVTSDELTIYFSSNRPGGQGDFDIWKATRNSINDPFSNIINLGKNVNTEGKEQFPTLRTDTRLYYSSDGLPGLGGYDLFYTEFQNNDWSEPENLRYPINSPYDEIGIVFNKNEDESIAAEESGYFSSNREGGIGGDDIYSFYRAPLLYTLSGKVRDDKSMQFVEGAKVKLIGSDKSNIETRTNRNGEYLFDKTQVKYNVNYSIQVSQVDYMNEEAKESTVGLTTSKDIIRDFKLKPIPKEPVVLPEIRYDLGKWDLLDQYQDSLSDLLVVLVNNPSYVIELGSHTDIRPFPKVTNDTLSQHRAESVVDFLFARGIDRDRLVAKGYGDRVPRTLTRDTEVEFRGKKFLFPKGITLSEEYINKLRTYEEKEAAHQLNRRTEFRILRTDFVPAELLDSIEDAKSKAPIVDLVRNTKPLPITTIPIIYKENNIPLSMINGKKALLYIILNGANVPAIYDERYTEAAALDWDVAMTMLLTGRITKDDFKEKEKAFDKQGNILDNSILIFKTADIGKHHADKYEVIVKKGMNHEMYINKNGIANFGRFTFDRANGELVFEK